MFTTRLRFRPLKRMSVGLLFTILALAMGFPSSGLVGQSAEGTKFVVIVNSSNSITEMSRKDLAKLFLKKKSKWAHGTKCEPVDLLEDSTVRADFSEAVLGKSVSSVKSYWQQRIFSGKAVPPPEKSSDREIIAFVRSSPGAVGYISAETDTSSVQILKVLD